MIRLSDKSQGILRVICVLAFLCALLQPVMSRLSETGATLHASEQASQVMQLADASFSK